MMNDVESKGVLPTTSAVFQVGLLALALVFSSAAPGTADTLPCRGVVLETRTGSALEDGWSGANHQGALPAGAATSWDILQRCTGDQSPCASNDDCGSEECVATCDCLDDTTCEVTGPVHERKCATTLTSCTTNADCPASVACVPMMGPPIPQFTGTPLCAVTYFDEGAVGTFDAASGQTELSATLRRRYFLGISNAQPCPRCGAPAQDPRPGDVFTCEGGQFPGATCTVEGVTETYGGTSSACPPSLSNALGAALPWRISNLTTGAVSRTAKLPCASATVSKNPLSPATNPRCTDDAAGPVCASNADCLRCSENPTIACSNNGDCSGNGTCAEAPDQPITCGYWCHCGFCNNDPAQPCFANDECPDGQTCVVGTGSSTSANAAQQKPNDCGQDLNICGETEFERCSDTKSRSCSLQPYRTCTTDFDCEVNAAGTCVVEGRSCFEPRIQRAGDASVIGSYCAFENRTCVSNADCVVEPADFCAPDSSRPLMVAAFCSPSTSNTTINGLVGLTGPATATLEGYLKVCRCTPGEEGCGDFCGDVTTTTTTTSTTTTTTTSTTTTSSSTTTTTLPAVCGNGVVQGTETCDDGDTLWSAGQHCNAQCKAVACGDTNDNGSITTSDALFTLRTSVGSATCSTKVCDANGNGSITSSDALLVLRKAVEQPVNLICS